MSQIDAIDFWIKQLSNKSDGTRKQYRYWFSKFTEWIQKSPNELIEIKKQSLEHKGDRRENMELETAFKQFMQEMKDPYSIGSQKNIYTAVLSFFELNQYPLNMKRGDRPSGEAIGSRIPEKHEVVTLINAARSRPKRAAILLLKDSGLRESDAVRLKWSEIVDYGDGFWGWKIITQKRKVKALPFVGPETTQALEHLERKSGRIFPISAKNLSNQLSLLIHEGGLKGLTPHGLRKFFNAELQAARVPKEWRYMMMGKKTGAYDENRHRKLFEAYKDAYSHLEIYGSGQSERIAELRKEVEDVKQKHEREMQALRSMLLAPSRTVEHVKRLEETQKEILKLLQKQGLVSHVEEKDGKRTLSTK